ncbi:hypothetical protein Tco_1033241 [Tanacetum coccineum]|uniref:Uncharacterized protein n=1 Tax=Tanacetum coccineum TaxID=301880 RepID=A0ABQ5GE34_9ASTR
MTRVNMFVDMDTEMKEGSNKAKTDTAQESSSKRAGDELEQEKAKKQKGDDDQEDEEMKKHMEIVQDDEVAIDAIPLATKPPMIVEYKIDKEGKIGYLKLIRVDGSSKSIEKSTRIQCDSLEAIFFKWSSFCEILEYAYVYAGREKKLEIQKKNIKFRGGLLRLKDFKIFLDLLLLSTSSIKVTTASYYFTKLLSDYYCWKDYADRDEIKDLSEKR